MFILGDLFEVWVGDDSRHAGFEAAVADVLQQTASLRSVAFMAGNRDFLVGVALLRDCGVMALADPTVLVACGERLLLTHGDALCLEDTAYQQFRAEVRTAHWRDGFLARPLAERRELAAQMRDASMRHQRDQRPETWADLDLGTTVQWMHEAGTPVLVHGHTHRPGTQELAPGFTRAVLSDWDLDAGPARAEVLRLSLHGLERVAPARVSLMLGRWWRTRRAARLLTERAIPDALWGATLSHYPFLGRRSDADLKTLRDLATLFLAEKEFTGANGIEVTDDMAVAIAAQACLPVLKLGLGAYARTVGIVVQPGEVLARREVTDEFGVVHQYDEELSGEAMEGGPVMLSWQDVATAGASAAQGYNVVVHEFVHLIDMANGAADGMPPLPDVRTRRHWRLVMEASYERFRRALDNGTDTFLDPYGGEALQSS